MRFMVMVKANEQTEAGVMPSEELLAAIGKYNEELAKSGVLLAGEGLQPSSKGARVKFSGKERRLLLSGRWSRPSAHSCMERSSRDTVVAPRS